MIKRTCFNIPILALLFLIGCNYSDDSIVHDEFMREYKRKNWKIIFSQVRKISLWNHKTGKISPIYEWGYPIAIKNPSIGFGREKILFIRRDCIKEKDDFISLDISSGKAFKIKQFENTKSLALSPDERKIAFLSEYDPGCKCFHSLRILNLETNLEQILLSGKEIFGSGYNFNLSWSPDGRVVAYSESGYINLLEIKSKKMEKLIQGYDPLFSPDGKKILFRKSIYKPYKPFVYDLVNGKTKKIKISRVKSAIWSPNSKYMLVIRNISNPIRWGDFSEWHRELVILDVNTMRKASLFQYDGYENIDCK